MAAAGVGRPVMGGECNCTGGDLEEYVKDDSLGLLALLLSP